MTVAVAYSDSAHGHVTLRRAAEDAVRRGEDLAVLRIVPGVDEPKAERSALEEQVARQLAEFRDLTWRAYATPEGTDTAGALLELAQKVDTSVLVIGSRRRSAVGKLLLGSTVQRVLIEAPMPVLLIKGS